MASQQVKGFGSTRKATDATKARNTFQNTENLYNQALVDWAFEDLSIPASKIIGGAGTPAITYDTTYTTSMKSTNGTVSAANAIAIGRTSQATYDDSVAIGDGATAQALRAVSIGNSADALTDDSVALGNGSTANAGAAIAIGNGAAVNATFTNSVAIGNGVLATAADEFNIGTSATNKLTFDDWTAGASVKTITHELGILVNGSRYYILLST